MAENCIIHHETNLLYSPIMVVCLVAGFSFLVIFLLTIGIMISNQELRTIPNILYLNMMFSDMMFELVIAPYRLYVNYCGTLNVVNCYLAISFSRASAIISMASFVLISLERFLKIKFYSSYNKIVNHKRVVIAILWVWIIAYNQAFIIDHKWPAMYIRPENNLAIRCSQLHFIWTISIIIDLVFFKAAPVALIAALNLKLYFLVKSHFKRMKDRFKSLRNVEEKDIKDKKRIKVEYEILFMGLAIIFLYIGMMGPQFVVNVLSLMVGFSVPVWIGELFLSLRLSYPFAESLVFFFFNKKLFQAFTKALKSCCSQSKTPAKRDSFS
ncbi:hypothetical protein RF11_12475 [Thelohanellus kitauei]|uniref:G-protein coupled receptors family 1 profile domain-containing protein n=1 Tax=Thelohanellus kitauei TaxID=669202 RepID=A0A0C2N0F7_THEKT|nr:hypothetical protein RF11_12475 [Thelohanellus kitauei]